MSKAFYDGSDQLQVFSCNQKDFITKKNGKSLFVYYGELIVIFLELDYCDKVVMKFPNDVTTYHRAINQLRVYIFLFGLDIKFEQI